MRVVAQENRLQQQEMPQLLKQGLDRGHGVVDQAVDGRAAREPTALAKPILLAICRHVEGELHRTDRRDHAEIVLAALDDRQRRGRRADALLGLSLNDVLGPLDHVDVGMRLLEMPLPPIEHTRRDAFLLAECLDGQAALRLSFQPFPPFRHQNQFVCHGWQPPMQVREK